MCCWTPADDRRLLWLAGTMPQARAARRLGRTLRAVQNRCSTLQIRWHQGLHSLAEVARETGWTGRTVTRMLDLLDIHPRRMGGQGRGVRWGLNDEDYRRLVGLLQRRRIRRPWSAEDDRAALAATDLHAAARELRRTYRSLTQRRRVLRRKEER